MRRKVNLIGQRVVVTVLKITAAAEKTGKIPDLLLVEKSRYLRMHMNAGWERGFHSSRDDAIEKWRSPPRTHEANLGRGAGTRIFYVMAHLLTG
jgi:hypothetical protein